METERDALGVKPLYWAEYQGEKVFADNVGELFAKAGIVPEIRTELLGEYFAQGWVCEPDTLFKGIYKVPAAGLGSVEFVDADDKSILRKSVAKACDGHVCNLFSGGIDSSVITALLPDKKIECFHMTLGDAESERVEKMEKKLGLRVSRLRPDASLCDLYPKLCADMGEPIADPGIIAAYWLGCEAKKRGYDAMLSGMGGDELDAGYPRNKLLSILWLLRMARACGAFALAKKVFSGKRLRDIKRLDAFLRNPYVENYFNLFGYFTKEEIDALVGEGWYEKYAQKVRGLTAEFSGKKKFFAYEYKGFLASHNNIYGAQAARAAGVECRCPILDPGLAAKYFKDIDNPRMAGKKRLTKILSDELGPDFVKVRKSGFRFPVEGYISKFTEGSFETVKRLGLIRKSGWTLVKGWLDLAHEGRINEVYMKLWAFWTLECWLKAYIVR